MNQLSFKQTEAQQPSQRSLTSRMGPGSSPHPATPAFHFCAESPNDHDRRTEMLDRKYGSYSRTDKNKKIRKKIKIFTSHNKKTKKNNNKFKLMTYNIQSVYNKVEEVELILQKASPTVLCLQETHLSQKTSLLRLSGYTCVESKKKFNKSRSAWDISELRSEYSWMTVKITSKLASGAKEKIIVVNIHTPHLSSHKNRMKKEIQEYLQNLIKKKSDKKIILAGDFNMDPKKTINWINKMGIGLTRTSVNNALGSRMKGTAIGRMIDHICSVNLHFQFIGASVIKNVDISDHFPVNSVWINSEITSYAEKTKKIDRKLITVEADKI
ncbi:hypothetical protein BB561_002341, partial [Smittium simulii]